MAIDLSSSPKNIQHDMLLLKPNVMFRCSPDVQEEAVTQDPQRYYQLDKPTLSAGLIAVRQDPDIIPEIPRGLSGLRREHPAGCSEGTPVEYRVHQ